MERCRSGRPNRAWGHHFGYRERKIGCKGRTYEAANGGVSNAKMRKGAHEGQNSVTNCDGEEGCLGAYVLQLGYSQGARLGMACRLLGKFFVGMLFMKY